MKIKDICPLCDNEEEILIVDSRPSPLGRRRRKECGGCNQRFSTLELLMNTKKNELSVLAEKAEAWDVLVGSFKELMKQGLKES